MGWGYRKEDGDTHKRRDGERKHQDHGGGENMQLVSIPNKTPRYMMKKVCRNLDDVISLVRLLSCEELNSFWNHFRELFIFYMEREKYPSSFLCSKTCTWSCQGSTIANQGSPPWFWSRYCSLTSSPTRRHNTTIV